MYKNFTEVLNLLTLCSESGNQTKIYDLLNGVSDFRMSGILRLIVLLNAFFRQMNDIDVICSKDYHSLELLCNSAIAYLEEFKN